MGGKERKQAKATPPYPPTHRQKKKKKKGKYVFTNIILRLPKSLKMMKSNLH